MSLDVLSSGSLLSGTSATLGSAAKKASPVEAAALSLTATAVVPNESVAPEAATGHEDGAPSDAFDVTVSFAEAYARLCERPAPAVPPELAALGTTRDWIYEFGVILDDVRLWPSLQRDGQERLGAFLLEFESFAFSLVDALFPAPHFRFSFLADESRPSWRSVRVGTVVVEMWPLASGAEAEQLQRCQHVLVHCPTPHVSPQLRASFCLAGCAWVAVVAAAPLLKQRDDSPSSTLEVNTMAAEAVGLLQDALCKAITNVEVREGKDGRAHVLYALLLERRVSRDASCSLRDYLSSALSVAPLVGRLQRLVDLLNIRGLDTVALARVYCCLVQGSNKEETEIEAEQLQELLRLVCVEMAARALCLRFRESLLKSAELTGALGLPQTSLRETATWHLRNMGIIPAGLCSRQAMLSLPSAIELWPSIQKVCTMSDLCATLDTVALTHALDFVLQGSYASTIRLRTLQLCGVRADASGTVLSALTWRRSEHNYQCACGPMQWLARWDWCKDGVSEGDNSKEAWLMACGLPLKLRALCVKGDWEGAWGYARCLLALSNSTQSSEGGDDAVFSFGPFTRAHAWAMVAMIGALSAKLSHDAAAKLAQRAVHITQHVPVYDAKQLLLSSTLTISSSCLTLCNAEPVIPSEFFSRRARVCALLARGDVHTRYAALTTASECYSAALEVAGEGSLHAAISEYDSLCVRAWGGLVQSASVSDVVQVNARWETWRALLRPSTGRVGVCRGLAAKLEEAGHAVLAAHRLTECVETIEVGAPTHSGLSRISLSCLLLRLAKLWSSSDVVMHGVYSTCLLCRAEAISRVMDGPGSDEHMEVVTALVSLCLQRHRYTEASRWLHHLTAMFPCVLEDRHRAVLAELRADLRGQYLPLAVTIIQSHWRRYTSWRDQRWHCARLLQRVGRGYAARTALARVHGDTFGERAAAVAACVADLLRRERSAAMWSFSTPLWQAAAALRRPAKAQGRDWNSEWQCLHAVWRYALPPECAVTASQALTDEFTRYVSSCVSTLPSEQEAQTAPLVLPGDGIVVVPVLSSTQFSIEAMHHELCRVLDPLPATVVMPLSALVEGPLCWYYAAALPPLSGTWPRACVQMANGERPSTQHATLVDAVSKDLQLSPQSKYPFPLAMELAKGADGLVYVTNPLGVAAVQPPRHLDVEHVLSGALLVGPQLTSPPLRVATESFLALLSLLYASAERPLHERTLLAATEVATVVVDQLAREGSAMESAIVCWRLASQLLARHPSGSEQAREWLLRGFGFLNPLRFSPARACVLEISITLLYSCPAAVTDDVLDAAMDAVTAIDCVTERTVLAVSVFATHCRRRGLRGRAAAFSKFLRRTVRLLSPVHVSFLVGQLVTSARYYEEKEKQQLQRAAEHTQAAIYLSEVRAGKNAEHAAVLVQHGSVMLRVLQQGRDWDNWTAEMAEARASLDNAAQLLGTLPADPRSTVSLSSVRAALDAAKELLKSESHRRSLTVLRRGMLRWRVRQRLDAYAAVNFPDVWLVRFMSRLEELKALLVTLEESARVSVVSNELREFSSITTAQWLRALWRTQQRASAASVLPIAIATKLESAEFAERARLELIEGNEREASVQLVALQGQYLQRHIAMLLRCVEYEEHGWRRVIEHNQRHVKKEMGWRIARALRKKTTQRLQHTQAKKKNL